MFFSHTWLDRSKKYAGPTAVTEFYNACAVATVVDIEALVRKHFPEVLRRKDCDHDMQTGFHIAVMSGNMDVAEYLDRNFKCRLWIKVDETYQACLRHGMFDQARWLMKTGSTDAVYMFENACVANSLQAAVFLKQYIPADRLAKVWYASAEQATRHQCVAIVKWLSSWHCDVHRTDDLLFRLACSLPSDEIAKAWYDCGGVDVRVRFDEALCCSLYCKAFTRSAWLMSLGCDPFAKNDCVIKAFSADFDNHEDGLVWMTNLYATHDRVIPECCKWAVRRARWKLRKEWLVAVLQSS
jgi:hypothetical protein